jgi:predicted Zn-dependent peptidase
MNTLYLKNNLEVQIDNDNQSHTSVICFAIKTGKSVEFNYFKSGINYIFQKLLFSGTDKYPTSRQIAIYLESIGAKVHTNVTFETFQIYIEVPYYNLSKTITLLADIIQNSHYEQADVEIAKKAVIDSYFSNLEDSTGIYGREFLEKFLYFNDIEKIEKTTTLETLMSITKDDILDYVLQQFQPQHSLLYLYGNINSESQLIDLIEQEWGDWNTKVKKYIDPVEASHKEFPLELPIVNYRQRGSFLAEVNLGFLIDNYPSAKLLDLETGEKLPEKEIQKRIPEFIYDYAKIVLLNQIVGGGIASRLWVKSIETDMLLHSVESDFVSLRGVQYLNIFGVAENNQFTFAFESILSGLESLKRSTISMHEISRNKEIIKAKLTLMNDNKLFKVLWIVENYLATGLIFNTSDFIDTINKIQAHEIRSLALDIFNSNRLVVYISGTAKERIIIDKLIKKYLETY